MKGTCTEQGILGGCNDKTGEGLFHAGLGSRKKQIGTRVMIDDFRDVRDIFLFCATYDQIRESVLVFMAI